MIFFNIIKKFRTILSRRQKIRIIELFLLMFLGGVLETLSVSLILPFTNAVMNLEETYQKSFVIYFCSVLGINSPRDFLIFLLAGQERLIQILQPDFTFEDERGCLTQLVHEGQRQVNVVTTRGGVFRGGHYHKENVETFYVVYGRFRFTAERDGRREEREFAAGDMFQVGPYVLHGFEYLEDSLVVALYDKGVEHADGTIDSYTE